MLQAIILDFDGVIADTERLHLQAFQEVLRRHGVELSVDEYYARYLGLGDAYMLGLIARDRGLAVDDARLGDMVEEKAACYARLIDTAAIVYNGAGPRMREWSRKVPLAVASGALRSEIETILGRAGLLTCFTAIVSVEDAARGKPAPDPFLVALAALNTQTAHPTDAARHLSNQRDQAQPRNPITAEGCIVIEDSLPGIEAAHAAGMRAVAVATNHPAATLSAADLVVPSLAALDMEILSRMVR